MCLFVYLFIFSCVDTQARAIGENALCLLICFKFLFLDLNFLFFFSDIRNELLVGSDF